MAFDLIAELEQLVDALHADAAEYALCGGLALAVHGHPRATKDIDLLVRAEAVPHLLALGITSPTEECRYFGWTWNAPATRTASGYDLGFAYDVALYTLGDGTPTPSCADLANADTDGDGVNDAEHFGCRRPHWAD